MRAYRTEGVKDLISKRRVAADQTALLVEMLQKNTQLTETVRALTERVETLTVDVHKAVVNSRTA